MLYDEPLFGDARQQILGQLARHQASESAPSDLEIPAIFDWLGRAALLPGKAPVQLAIFLAGTALKYNRHKFLGIRPKDLRDLQIGRTAAHQALRAMEEAGLIEAKRQHGKTPQASICLASDSVPTEE